MSDPIEPFRAERLKRLVQREAAIKVKMYLADPKRFALLCEKWVNSNMALQIAETQGPDAALLWKVSN